MATQLAAIALALLPRRCGSAAPAALRPSPRPPRRARLTAPLVRFTSGSESAASGL